MSKQTIIFSILFTLMFGWNGYLTYTINKNFKDCALAISAVDDKIENLDRGVKLDKLIESTKPQYHLPLFDSSQELERRIQSLEYQTDKQQSKLNDVERDTYWASSNAYWNNIEQEKKLEELKKKQEGVQNRLDYPIWNK